MGSSPNSKPKIIRGSAGYVLEDVPHLSDYIPELPVRRRSTSFSNSSLYAFLMRPVKSRFFAI